VNVNKRIPICVAHHIQYLPIWAKFNDIPPPAAQEGASPESDSGPWIAAPLFLRVRLAFAKEEKEDPDHSLAIDAKLQESTTPREEINGRARIPRISFDFSHQSGYMFSCLTRESIWGWHTLERS
jgi:hypothetical protein